MLSYLWGGKKSEKVENENPELAMREEVFPKIDAGDSYQVKMKIFNGKSFFYKTPSDRYKRKEYISNWNFVTIERIEYGFGFEYFYNNEDDVIKEGGWLDMSSLEFRGKR